MEIISGAGKERKRISGKFFRKKFGLENAKEATKKIKRLIKKNKFVRAQNLIAYLIVARLKFTFDDIKEISKLLLSKELTSVNTDKANSVNENMR